MSRVIEYTINEDGLLTKAVDAGGRTWNYTYSEEEASGARAPVTYNLTQAIKDFGLEEKIIIDNLAPASFSHHEI